MHEHLRDLGVDLIGRVVTHVDVLGEEELPDYEVAVLIGQHVHCLDRGGSVPRPNDVDLHRKVRCWHEDALNRIEPVHGPVELGGVAVVEPQDLRYGHGYPSGYLVVLIEDAIIVVIPVAGFGTIGAVVRGPALLEVVPVQIGSVVGIVVLIPSVGTSVGVRGIRYARTIAEVVVVPWVRRLAVEP